MDRLREQFNRRSGARRIVKSDSAAQPPPHQSLQTQAIAEDEELYGLKELWPDELRGYSTVIE
jgi:hypothetical protein